MALNPTDGCGLNLMDQSIPQWKRELIIRRRALGRTLQVGNSSVKLTCPAVVAIVRQPEILSASENVTTCKQQRSSASEESTSTFSSVNQNRVDFHPSTSSAVADGNMRLLDTCSDVNNVVINGIDVKNKQSELVVSNDLCMNYNLIMGEDKSLNLKKKSATSRSKFDHNSYSVNRHQNFILHQVAKEGTNGKPIKDEDCLSDSSEELQYGPGIVNKLKTKYLSMTLREQKRHLRPSIINLRRATSLENMLEGDGNLNKQNKSVIEANVKTENVTVNNRTITGKPYGLSSHRAMKHLGNRSLDTMKRARSMDTLLKSESRTTLRNNFGADNRQNILNNDISNRKPIASIVNENVIIVENLSVGVLNETSKHKDISPKASPTKCLKKDMSIPANQELPPPDLVKQALKIFETSPKKKVKPPSQSNLAKLVAGFSNSTNQPISSVNCRSIDKMKTPISNKPILSPKPVLSPEKLRQNRSRVSSPKKIQGNSSVPIIHSPSKAGNNFEKQQLQLEIGEPISNTNVSKSETIGITSPKASSPRSISPVVTVVANNEQVSTTVHSRSSCFQNSQNFEEKNSLSFKTDQFEEVDSGECTKPVLESALENIRSGGVSMQFSFNNENEQNSTSKWYLPRPKSPPQALNTSLVKQNLEKSPSTANIAPLRSQSSPHTKQVGIIRPIVSTKIQPHSSPPTLTEQEIEKNLINRVKSIEQPISKVVVAIKALPDNVVLGSVSTDTDANKSLSLPRVCTNSKTKNQGLWDEKLWHQNQNTIVFNFSDRKEVPDYIENDGLILRGKRDRPRPGEGGFILLDNTGEESSTDAEEQLISDPPSPCDVTFVGDNVLINGKSNLKKSPKQVKLRIKFNDKATTMFEYPSEASLVEEEMSTQAEACGRGSEEGSSQASAATPTPLPMPLGGPPPDYLPPPVPSSSLKTQLPPTQVGIWPSPKLPDPVANARAPETPVQNLAVTKHAMLPHSSLLRSPSDPGNTAVHQLHDTRIATTVTNNSSTAKKDIPQKILTPSSTMSKEKYFSIKKTRNCDKKDLLSPSNYVPAPILLNPQNKGTPTDPVVAHSDQSVSDISKLQHKSSSVSYVNPSSNKGEIQSSPNSDNLQSLSTPYYYPSSILNETGNASVYHPVYSKPRTMLSLLTSNAQLRNNSTLNISDLKVDHILSSVLSREPVSTPPVETTPVLPPSRQVLVLDDWPLGTESLV